MKINIELSDQQVTEIWSQTFGTAGEEHGWWLGVEFLEGDWDFPGRAELTVEDPEGGDPISAVVDAESIVAAAFEVAATCVDACTGRPITIGRSMDWDSCVSDCVLQVAVLGTVVYG